MRRANGGGRPRRRPATAEAGCGAAAPGGRTVNLALQGGGAHGAFTWGVLDRLLEEPRLGIEGVTATSAGAMNATVLAYGMAEGGREGARQALARFWRRISDAALLSPLQPSLIDRLAGNRALEHSPAFVMFDIWTRLLSPYQFNPFNYNPLRRVLEEVVDFGKLRRKSCPLKLFLSATNVRTGKVKVFDNESVTADAVLASGCLPFLFQAVEIEGEAYWDGGYMGNPAIFPLIYNCDSTDVVIVHINPLERPELPRTATEIMNRINEISFNSSLMREMRAIEFVTRMIDEGALPANRARRMRIHAIAAGEEMARLSVASKLNADWDALSHLFAVGRRHAEDWLAASLDRVGRESTVDIRSAYL
ncbi:MAG: patatin-like phospholipase family protein [Dongiaceae bacterium]